MAHAGYEQLTLGLFDTASPYSLSLGGSAPAARAAEPVAVPELPPVVPGVEEEQEQGIAVDWPTQVVQPVPLPRR